MDVSIVIVSWKVKNELKICLKSLFTYTNDIDCEVFVVDNNSEDGSTDLIKNEFPKVTLIENKENFGFAKACNQAIKISKGKYILLLNPDTEFRGNTVKNMYEYMQLKSKCGISGCKISNFDGTVQPSVRKLPDISSHILILLKIHNIFSKFKSLNNYYQIDFDYSKEAEVDQIMGAFFMIDRELLKEIGLLDENFYIWYEEVDLCNRAINADWHIWYNPNIEILHQKGSSFSQVNPLKKQYIFNRSMLYYFFKNKSIFQYLFLLVLTPVSLFITFMLQLTGMKKKRKDL